MPERPLDGITLKSPVVDGRMTEEIRGWQGSVERNVSGADHR